MKSTLFVVLPILVHATFGLVKLNGNGADLLGLGVMRNGQLDFSSIRTTRPLEVGEISIARERIINGDYRPLSRFANLRSLYFNDLVDAPRITNKFFRYMPRLETFMVRALDDRSEIEFEEDALAYANNLRNLLVERLYTISSLSKYFLRNSLGNLVTLTLDYGAISEIERDAFDYTPNLKKLYLRHHGNMTIQNGAFGRLTRLEELDLEGTVIENFSWEIFQQPQSALKYLKLSDISPDKLVPHVIKHYLPNLKELTVHVGSDCRYYSRIPTHNNAYDLSIYLLGANNRNCDNDYGRKIKH